MNDSNMFSLQDKVVVVTGGTGILGNAFVDAIVEAGGKVAILGRKKKWLMKERQLLMQKAEVQ